MPSYIFDKNAFLEFVEKHFDENTVVIVSSDFTDCKLEKIDSPLGLKDFYSTKGFVAKDMFVEDDPEDFDGMMRYLTVFCEKDELTDETVKRVRTK